MSTITIVRHGDTFAPGEPPRRVGARTDLPLVASGRAQAARLRAAFDAEERRFDRAWTSPLKRTCETAAVLLAGTATALDTAAWLAEIDHGPDENRPEDQVLARIGADTLARWERDAEVPPGWRVDAAARLAGWRGFLADAAQDGGERLVVTSNGAARFALLADAALSAQARALPSLKLRTGAWGRLRCEQGDWRLAAWDRRPAPLPVSATRR